MQKKQSVEKITDKQIVLSVQQLLTYGVFLITFGASIYTFFKAIPKIDKLDQTVNELQISNARVEERIVILRETLAEKRNNKNY